ncbi:cation transporter [Flavobacterium salilacus subsp. salilacus]|uniref:cation diffusion facilitator family transporter n=1 Tax=Flavobacterium TaxID=237 RepID=UPI00107577A4|nr:MULTISPECIES: cation diffusion facilitator family transporter [Flavobacterium]KAF2518115.1 cation transporter [Flavobacterium salilacus subsp. salilacus]MBE1615575.1 cation transporter [Flavobacterium sp. SaA2.13]
MSHSHSHDHANKSGNNLKVAFFLNLSFTVLEIVGGLYVNSVAILSDALHDLGDSFSLGLSWYLNEHSKKKPNNKFTFGYSRFSLMGAFINSIILIGGSVYIIIEAIKRLMSTEEPNAEGMFLFAIVGIAVNGYAAFRLSDGKTLNERVVSLHLIEDVLGWVAVLIASVVMMFVDAPYLDPLLSLGITVYILYNVIKRMKETLVIMLQGTPYDIDPEKLKSEILQVQNVLSLHHVHIWSLEGEHHVFAAHVRVNNTTSFNQVIQIKNAIKAILKQYPFSHYTIEVELEEEPCELENS